MDKIELLANHGKSKVKDIAGILHIYTPHGTLNEAEEIERLVRIYGNYPLSKVFDIFEDLLELN